MKKHFSPGNLLFFLFLLAFLLAFIQIGLLSFAFEKLGLPPSLGLMVLLLSLLGSAINLPITRIKSTMPPRDISLPALWGVLRIPMHPVQNETLISVNLGGCLIPAALSFYMFTQSEVTLLDTMSGIAIISVLSYYFSRPIPGAGIGMPILFTPVCAAMVGLILSPDQSAPLAYISGTMGVLIGADLLHT